MGLRATNRSLPKDAGVLVRLMNGISVSCGGGSNSSIFRYRGRRPKPFSRLCALGGGRTETHLYLGLLQFDDDAGNRFRIRAAQRVVQTFGVAAECGFGTHVPKRVPLILAGYRAAAEMLA